MRLCAIRTFRIGHPIFRMASIAPIADTVLTGLSASIGKWKLDEPWINGLYYLFWNLCLHKQV